MKKISIWIALWVIVGVVGIYSIINDKMKESKDNEVASYAEKCYDINGVKCISFEQMKYIARKRMSTEEIDAFSEKCGFLLKGKKSEDAKLTSQYGLNGFVYDVVITNNYYSFYFHSSADYINRLRSDLKAEDSSATGDQNHMSSDKIEGLVVNMNWDLSAGSIVVAIIAKS